MLDNLLSWIGSRGNQRGKSLSIPVFDGAFKPNNLLEDAHVLAENAGFTDLIAGPNGKLLAACDNTVAEISKSGEISEIARFDSPVTSLAQLVDGTLAVGLDNQVILAADTKTQKVVDAAGGAQTDGRHCALSCAGWKPIDL